MKINKEGTKFAKQADISDNIEIISSGNSFVTFKKLQNFMSHPVTKPINPSKKKEE